MYAIRSYYVLELLAAFSADVFKDGHILTLRGSAEIRRQLADGLEEEVVHEIAEHVARGDGDLLHRITSYNVCYTKLLRMP